MGMVAIPAKSTKKYVAYVRVYHAWEIVFLTTNDQAGQDRWIKFSEGKWLPLEIHRVYCDDIDPRMSIRV